MQKNNENGTDTPAPAGHKPLPAWVELLPLLVFFGVYQLKGLMAATAAVMAATLITAAIVYIKNKRVPTMLLVTAVLVGVMGSLTLYLKDDSFIKMKPTLIYALFSLVLLAGQLLHKPLLPKLLGHALPLTQTGWHKLSWRWVFFFAFMACLNESIWRTQPEEIWVKVRVFGYLTLTILFTLSQLPLMKRHFKSDE